ncbi:hypothetical protein [Burkholderia multivorans]|nr:hypothetical protein [Burkholderia multivorans]
MARPSSLEDRAVFAVPNGVGLSADFAFQAAGFFAFRQLSTATLLLY